MGYILISVICYGLIPPVIGYIGGEKLPFFFLAAWRMGVVVSCVAVLVVVFLPLWLKKSTWSEFKSYMFDSKTKAVDWEFSKIGKRNYQRLGISLLQICPAEFGKDKGIRIKLLGISFPVKDITLDELRFPLLKWGWKIPGELIDWRILLCILGNCEYALLAWSFRFIDISVATILFQSWPFFNLIFTLALLGKTNRNSDKKEDGKPKFAYILLIGLGFVGFAFVIASQTGSLGELGEIPLRHLVIGVVLAVGAAALGPMKNLSIIWANNLINTYKDIDEKFIVVVALLISSFGAAVIGVVVGLGRSESLDVELLGQAFLGGMILNATAGIMWRICNMDEDNKSFNALGFATPVLSLLFLLWFQLAEISEVDYLILGVMAMVVANLLINFEAEVRWSFEALILALGGCGTVIYFRDEMLLYIGIPKWGWSGDGYFASIGMTATIFTLLLAFRVARLITRTNDEESRTFNILRKLDRLVERGVIHKDENGDVRDCIVKIDETNKQDELEKHYRKARSYIAKATPKVDSDRDTLAQVEADLDVLVRSQQQTPVLGEIFALLVFAGITIFLTIFTKPPEPDGWLRMMLDLFAMLVSSVIIFLMMYSMDLDRERDAHILEQHETPEGVEYLLYFSKTRVRLFDQWLSVAVGVIIILIYAGLLAHKWVGWFGGTPLPTT